MTEGYSKATMKNLEGRNNVFKPDHRWIKLHSHCLNHTPADVYTKEGNTCEDSYHNCFIVQF